MSTQTLSPQIKEVSPAVHVTHILLTGPLLVYIGFAKPMELWPYVSLYILGAALCFLMGYKILHLYVIPDDILATPISKSSPGVSQNQSQDQSQNNVSISKTYKLIIYIVHLFLVAPLFILTGVLAVHRQKLGDDLPRWIPASLIIIGAAVILFHTYKLILQIADLLKHNKEII